MDEIYEELPPLSENNVSFVLSQPSSTKPDIHSAAHKTKIEAVMARKNSSPLLSQPSSTWQHTNYDPALVGSCSSLDWFSRQGARSLPMVDLAPFLVLLLYWTISCAFWWNAFLMNMGTILMFRVDAIHGLNCSIR